MAHARMLSPLAAILLLLAATVRTDAATPASTGDPLFESGTPLAIRISGPLREIARDRAEEPDYRPGALQYVDAHGTARTFEIGLRPRGHFRRGRDVCTFPPIRVNLRKKDVEGTLFGGQDKLKLVVHCRRTPRHDRFVYREFLVYRLLNQLTDASFRVRALDIEWVDTGRDDRSERRFGFFIEDDDRLAARLDLEEVEPERLSPEQLAPLHTTLMELFEFMIGNTDFSFIAGPAGDHCCHNAVLLLGADGRFLPVPYDFDITGFVDPPYAEVNDELPIANVRRRLFRGFCRDEAVLIQALERFRAARPAMIDVVRRETALEQADRDEALAYLDDFFAIIDDPSAVERRIVEDCRGDRS